MKGMMKKNQIIITVLAVMFAIAGYLTYAGKGRILSTDESAAREAIAEYDAYVSESEGIPEETQESTVQAETEAALKDIESLDYDIEEPGEAVLANGLTVSDFLAQSRLSREQTRGRNREDLLKIIDNDSENQLNRQAAIDAVVRMSDCSDRENAAETLLGAKGFENSIVSITDDKVDVVICRNNLTDAELAQIEDIVKRKADVKASQICIALMGTQE